MRGESWTGAAFMSPIQLKDFFCTNDGVNASV